MHAMFNETIEAKILVSHQDKSQSDAGSKATYIRTLISSCRATNWVRIPLVAKIGTFGIYLREEKPVNQPDVVPVRDIQMVVIFKSIEKCTPASDKLATNFDPESLDPRVTRESGK